ncbi:glutaminase [Pseudarthrobacter sp. AL07]|uniref:glutaminase n=1 Tax=unclassified Pseudarthrobacter TaxID=2647000 RepID=UPI00249BAAD0|nr:MULTISPECIES: glutaminase [unclassified Pseudarthrobacter]MDI3195500.1 glutaminase [Pseudarthrobacter sp. AL20]MDI3209567.1 glutaminase [Pseudarthrobacter sp. AL07]
MTTALKAPPLDRILDEIVRSHRPQRETGSVPANIPLLAAVPFDRFGIAVATTSGRVFRSGDADVPFSIQSISKVFTLAMALRGDSSGTLWSRVLREPSGTSFNSLVQLELEHGIPRNPFINAGALVVTDHLMEETSDAATQVLRFLTAQAGSPGPYIDEAAAASELSSSSRNLALAHFLKGFGNLRQAAESVVENYVRQCSIMMTCVELAKAGLFLARDGRGARGSVVSASDAKRIGSIMLTCGMYDAAGEFAYRVGLPGKSGVGGGILVIVPGECAICVWSPRLDAKGNSLAGTAALADLSDRTGWSVF